MATMLWATWGIISDIYWIVNNTPPKDSIIVVRSITRCRAAHASSCSNATRNTVVEVQKAGRCKEKWQQVDNEGNTFAEKGLADEHLSLLLGRKSAHDVEGNRPLGADAIIDQHGQSRTRGNHIGEIVSERLKREMTVFQGHKHTYDVWRSTTAKPGPVSCVTQLAGCAPYVLTSAW